MKNVTLIINIVGDWSAAIEHRIGGNYDVCVFVTVTEVLWGGAVRVQDTQYVADDVSKQSLWTATLSQQESVEIGEREREEGGREEQQEQEGTLEGLFLWVTVLLVLSALVPLIENQTAQKKKKSLSLFTPVSLQFLFLTPPPLSFSIHSSFYFLFYFIENLFSSDHYCSDVCNENHLLGP